MRVGTREGILLLSMLAMLFHGLSDPNKFQAKPLILTT